MYNLLICSFMQCHHTCNNYKHNNDILIVLKCACMYACTIQVVVGAGASMETGRWGSLTACTL